LKAFADRIHPAEGLEEAPKSIGRHAEDFEIDVLGHIIFRSHESIAHPAADNQRAAARIAYRARDLPNTQ
jgi:hypothetical protein